MQLQLRPVDYTIVVDDNPTAFAETVAHKLSEGWVLHGDTKMVYVGSSMQYSQPLVMLEARPIPMPTQSGLSMPSIVVPQ